MLNIHELERQWKAYKKRTLKPYLFAVLGLFIFILLTFFFFPATQNKEKVTAAKPQPSIQALVPKALEAPQPKPVITPTPVIEPQNSISKASVEPTPPPAKVETVTAQPHALEPSFDFIKNIHETAPTTKKKKKVRKKSQVPKSHKTQKTQTPSKSEHPIAMTSTSSDRKMQALTKRFAQSKNPALGIVIARLYYEKKAYALAYKYALEVNAIDETNIDSWLLAGQSLYFLDKKDDAIHLLESFIQKTHSSRAQKLLRQIRSGTVQ